VIDPTVVETLVAPRARLDDSRLAGLTARELDVLRAMAQGKTNAAIVNAIFARLGLSEEPRVHRRVAAVLTLLRDSGLDQ
jgi:DNA-binding NarL/FixJ family response regulator